MPKERIAGREIKLRNKVRILRYVHAQGRVTKQQLSEALSISLPTILQNVKDLSAEGLIRTTGRMESTGGRKAAAIEPVRDARMAVGADVTRDSFGLALIDLTGRILKARRYDRVYRRDVSYYREAGRLVDHFIEEAGINPCVVLGVGISIPGIIDNAGQTITHSHALDICGVPCAEFSGFIRYPCLFINDANAAGLSELHADASLSTFVYLSLNHRVGGAIFIRRRLSLGDNMRAGEFGHMRLFPQGRRCYCGMDGCVDAYCNAMVLADAAGGSIEQFMEKLKGGDAAITRVWDEYLDALCVAVNNLCMAFDCPVVLGGYAGGHLGDHLEDIRRRSGLLNTFTRQGDYVRVCRSRAHASALGAAMLHTEAFFLHLS